MPTITLKDIPRNLHRDLKKRAAAHHRSLNKEVIATLQTVTTSTPMPADVDTMIAEAREVRRRFKRVIKPAEISAWKKQGRL